MENNEIIVNCVDTESISTYNNDGMLNKAFVSGIDSENKEEIEETQNEESTNEFNFQECATKLKAIVIDDSEENRVKQATNFIDNEILNQPGSASDMELFIESRINNHFSFTKKGFINLVKKSYTGKIKSKREYENKESKNKQEEKKNKTISISSMHTKEIYIPENVNKEISNWDKYILPKGEFNNKYIMADKGIVYRCEEWVGAEPVLKFYDVSRTPFVISGKTEQLKDGTVFYEIRYGNGKRQKEVMVKKTELQPASELRKTLARFDINVTDEMIKRTEEYISMYILQFGDKIHSVKTNDANGWNDDCTEFFCGNQSIIQSGIVPVVSTIQDKKVVEPFHRAGTLNGWCKGVQPALEFKIARFTLYDSMAAPLYKVLSVYDSQMTVISGPTSKGKTAIANLANSTMGKPNNTKDSLGLEFPVGTSVVPLIGHAAGMSDMSVHFDEATGEVRAKVMVDAGYDIVNGTEKSRGKTTGENKAGKSMRVQPQITCERPLREYTKHAGAQYRINDIGGEEDLIPKGNGELVENLKREIFSNYGHFFPIYIQFIINNKEKVKEFYEKALQKVESDFTGVPEESKNTAGRSKAAFALKIVAGYICEEIFKDLKMSNKNNDEVEEIVNYFFKKSVLSSPVEPDWKRALRHLADTMISEKNKFYTANDKDEISTEPVNKSECIGNLHKNRADIIGTQLTRILKECGFPASVAKDWKEKGITNGAETVYIGIKKQAPQKANGYKINIKTMNEILGIVDTKEGAEDDTGKNNTSSNTPYHSHNIHNQKVMKLISAIVAIKGYATIQDIENIFGKDADGKAVAGTYECEVKDGEGKAVKNEVNIYVSEVLENLEGFNIIQRDEEGKYTLFSVQKIKHNQGLLTSSGVTKPTPA